MCSCEICRGRARAHMAAHPQRPLHASHRAIGRVRRRLAIKDSDAEDFKNGFDFGELRDEVAVMAKCRQLRERHPTQGRTERRLQLTDSLGRHGAERVLDLLDIVSRGNPCAEPGITHGAGVLPGSGVGDCGQPRSPLGHRGTIEGCQCCRLKPHLCARRLRACGELDQPVLYLRQRHRPRGPGVIQAGDVGVELPASGSTALGHLASLSGMHGLFRVSASCRAPDA